MRRFRALFKNEWLVWILMTGVLNLSVGCAAIFRGTSQTVRVITTPEGKSVYYQGMKINDGDMITVQKHFDHPQFNVGQPDRPIMASMNYDPDPWLIGDCVLLFFFIIPGVVALGVDFGTGAWRNLDDPQQVYARED